MLLSKIEKDQEHQTPFVFKGMARRLSSNEANRRRNRAPGLSRDARAVVANVRSEAKQPKELLKALERESLQSSWKDGLSRSSLETALKWSRKLKAKERGKDID